MSSSIMYHEGNRRLQDRLIQDGDVVASSGYGGNKTPEALLTALELRFLETGSPRDLTLVWAGGQGYTKDRVKLGRHPCGGDKRHFESELADGIACVIGICGSAQIYPGATRNAVWRELIPIFAGIAILTPVGAVFLFNTDPDLIRRAMGVLILVFALVLVSGWVYRGPRGPFPSTIVGALAGGITGATGVGGPPLALYFLSSPASPEVQRSNIVMTVTILIMAALVSIIIAGGFTTDALLRAVILTPAYVLGTWSGAKLFAFAPKAYFKRVALWLLVTTGIGVLLL